MQKGIKKFVNGYRAKNGKVFPKRYKEIRQWVQGEKWEHLSQKVLRNSSMGTGRKMGTSFPKGIKKFVNGYRVKEIYQWVQSEIANRHYDKNDRFYDNLR